jgi:hypothetical protein
LLATAGVCLVLLPPPPPRPPAAGTLAAPNLGRWLGRQHGHAARAGLQDVVEAMVEHEVAHVALLGTLEVLDLEVVDDVAIAAASSIVNSILMRLGSLSSTVLSHSSFSSPRSRASRSRSP